MPIFFLAAAVLIALVDWLAVARNWKRIEYIAKPGVMAALFLWLWQASGLQGPLIWFAAGLLFSMSGDIFLMLPRERFIAGLVSFLLAHVAYTAGFNQTLPPVNLASLVVVLLVGIPAGQLVRRIMGSLAASGKAALKIPVLVYSIVISLMLISALNTLVRSENTAAGGWLVGPALLVSSGALLFILSDAFLAWNRFVAPLPNSRLRVIIPYHLGQILIVVGAALQYLLPLAS